MDKSIAWTNLWLYYNHDKTNAINPCLYFWFECCPSQYKYIDEIWLKWLNNQDAALILTWWIMMTSSNGNIFHVTGPLCGEITGPDEFPTQRSVTWRFGAFFDLRLNKRLSKQSWGWWFETPPWSLWRQCNVFVVCEATQLRWYCVLKIHRVRNCLGCMSEGKLVIDI